MKTALRVLLRLVLILGVIGVTVFVPQKVAWSAPETRSQKVDVTTDQPFKIDFPATHVAVSWNGDLDATFQVRGQDANGRWSDWQELEGDTNSGERPVALVLVDNATTLQVQHLTGNVSDVLAQAIDTANGPRHLEVVDDTKAASAIDGATPNPGILSRADWGANESLVKGTPEFAPVSRFIVHHTDTANDDPNPAATVRAILAYHTQSNGWNDIGYNFLIDQQGRIYEGRKGSGAFPGEDGNRNGVVGAHALNYNNGTIGISMLGNFTSQAPTSAQQSSLSRLIAFESDRHNIDLSNAQSVVGHRDVNQTTCPGQYAENLLPQIRGDANAIKTVSYPPGNTPGYWVAKADGGVYSYGSAQFYGSMGGKPLNSQIISMTKTPSGKGYWLMGADGGIFSFGDAQFYGSMGGKPLNQPVRALASTPSGKGYWLVASDGGVFAFGDAKFYGSMGGKPLNQQIVGMSSTPSGNGYWMVASDGGIFAFGDAGFYGSTGSIKLAQPMVSMSAAPGGNGYWLMARDGGVFAYNTRFWGSVPMLRLNSFSGAVQAAATQTGSGYYMLSSDGGVYTFGDARFWGAPTGGGNAVSIVLQPAPN